MTDISCSQLMSEYYAAKSKVMELVDVPLAILGAVGSVINKVTDAAINSVTSMLGLVDGSMFTLSVPDMLYSLERLLSCAAIADSAMGATIAGAIDVLDAGGSMPEDMADLLRSQAQGQFGGAVNDIASTPAGKLGELGNMYTDALSSGDVGGAMDTLSAIESCMATLCSEFDSGGFSATNLKNQLGMAADNTVNGVVGAVQGVPQAAKDKAAAFETNYKALKTSISTKTFETL